jgi:hypothetical protein
MKHMLNISVLLLLTVINTFSQAVFKSGFIIKNNNDTVFGLIEFKGNRTNSKVCIFKQNIESESQEYTPDDIKAYRFDDSKYYISKVVTIADKEEPLFLEYLINGRVDVYYYFDGLAEHYLIDGGDNQLVELKEGSQIITANKKRLILPSKQYMGILKYVFRESPAISKQAETVQLNRNSLINIAHAYHNEVCANEECIIYEKKAPHENIKFGVLAGLGVVTVSVAEKIPVKLIYFRNSDFGLALCPSVGFFVKANIPAIDAHLFFQYQATLSFLNLKTTNSYVDIGNNFTVMNKISINQTFLGNKGLFKYEFGEGQKVHPSIQVGFFFNYSFLFGYSRKYEIRFPSGDLLAEGEGADEYDLFSGLDYGPVVGFGFVFDKPDKKAILVDIQYQRGFGLLEYLKVNYFSLNVGYQF